MKRVIKYDPAAIMRVSPHVRIQDVHGVRLVAEALTPFPEPAALWERPHQVRIQHHARVEYSSDAELSFLVEFEAFGQAGTEQSGEDEVDETAIAVARVTACFRVVYLIVGGQKPASEDLQAFGSSNAVYNCWPYWREYLQTSMSRLGQPAFVAPVLVMTAKIKKKELPAESDSDADEPADVVND